MLKGKSPLIIALLLGLLAAVLVWYQLRTYRQEATAGWELQDVVVAAADLQPGAVLSHDTVTTAKFPRKFVYESVLVPEDLDVALKRELMVPVKRGEPLHWYQLRGIRALERLSKSVRKQGRAISIDVSERSAVGQWIRPNDSIDILSTLRDPKTNEMVTITLLQNVLVLATGQTTGALQVEQSDMQYGTITLLVLPEEAEILVLAQELGTLYLTLRNISDPSIFEEEGRTSVNTLLTGERRKEVRKKRAKMIRIIRGPKDR